MEFEVGQITEGKVSGITKFGVFVALEGGKTGMVHISEVSKDFVKDLNDYVKIGDVVKVKVIGAEKGKISLSMSKAVAPEQKKADSFEEMLSKFKQRSDDKMSDLKRSTDQKRGGPQRRGRK